MLTTIAAATVTFPYYGYYIGERTHAQSIYFTSSCQTKKIVYVTITKSPFTEKFD